jgi:hypothetical protein
LSSIVPLGRLQKVELRDAWPHEAGNFTPWLAQSENLALLGEAIGIELVFEAMEKPVENFSADILAKDVATDRWVLIENQLEQTDHSHLGQILTYAAGLDAQTIIWIAKEFREPHRAAIDYLNHISAPEFNFFGVQLELFRIGDSDFAPSFNVVAKPNDWSKQIMAKATDRAEATERHQEWMDYWSGFFPIAETFGVKLVNKKPPKEGWCRIEQLKSGDPNAAAWVHWSNAKFRALIWLQGSNRMELFDELYHSRTDIQQAVSLPVIWDRMETKKSSMISMEVVTDGFPGFENENYQLQYQWFAKYIRELVAAVKPFLSPK